MKVYVGFKEGKRLEILHSETAPTRASHPEYDFFCGPFRTVEDASNYVKAMTGLACGDG